MDLLKKLEQRVLEQWSKVKAATNAKQRQKLMQVYLSLYQQLKKQREWIAAMEGL